MIDSNRLKPDYRYTVTLQSADGRLRPSNLYVYRTYGEFMVVRSTDDDGLLRKIPYSAIERIVDETAVDPANRYALPAAVLDEKSWRGRDVMQIYASSAGRGK